jgi:preprotein translocase subunit SecE
MSAKADSNPITVSNISAADYAILFAGLLVIGLGIFAYYYFNPQWASWVRTLVFVAGLVGGCIIAALSQPGKSFLKFLDAALLEVRKVVWPTKEETTQTTMVVAVAVIVVGLMMLLIDFLLSHMVGFAMGGG